MISLMAFLRLVVLAFVLVTSQAQKTRSNITRGSSLTPAANSSWLSNSGLYAFGFYKEGNGYSVGIFLAGIPEKTVVWTAKRDLPPLTSNATVLFSNDGRLVLQWTQDPEYLEDLNGAAFSASMLDSGNFVLYDSRGSILWQSFDNPTDTLLPTQSLLTGKELISSRSESDHSAGIFRLKMQQDGNLVQYPVNTPDTSAYAYWASSNLPDAGGYTIRADVTLVFGADAQLYMRNSTDMRLWNVSDVANFRKGAIYLMRIDADGIFRVYSHNLNRNGSWSIEWSSSEDRCDPKGLCGINGFCVMLDQEASCRCLPGFQFVDAGNWTTGCERNFTTESCGNKNKSGFAMVELLETVWENDPYSVLSLPQKEDCKQACIDDCNCDAAFYKYPECRKQRIPLRFGRRKLGDSNIALIKKYTSIINTERLVPKENKKKVGVNVLIPSVFLIALGSVMLVIAVVVLYRSNSRAYKRIGRGRNDAEMSEVGPRLYNYEELENMTDGFREEIGRGSFGTVYKGTILGSQKLVAVKRLEKVLEEGETEFQNEMRAIGRTNHRNLVHLLGYCHEGPRRLLVYEYMNNGSLANMLFATEDRPCWDERLGIACGIARGILYLHEECETQIIHCDIKPENILMDENRCAKISDFGLAKLLKPDQSRTFTGIRGTRGYVAPEWHRKLPITVKADVYSFGIVLLEIICCRKNVIWDHPEEEAILEEWAFDCFESGELHKLVGSEEIEKKQLNRTVKVALWCIQDEPSLRPSMKKVLLMLEGTVDIPIPPSPNSIISKI
ncbi:hypothetical protein UlMin_037932 [Ulmus minor]